MHLYVENDGHLFPCCLSSPYDQPNHGREGRAFVMDSAESAHTARNSEHNRSMRAQMLKGEWPSACRSCRKIEALGADSPRTSVNEHFLEKLPDAIRAMSFTADAEAPLLSVDFRLGNLCNLRCRMCGPQASAGTLTEWQALGLHEAKESETRDFEWYEKEELWRTFFAANPSIEELTIAGGEPFLSPSLPKLLDHLIEARRAEKIFLTLHSNVTKIPEGLPQRFERFRGVNLRISLDGTESVNSYIRYPSRWQKIQENLASLNEWAKWPFLQLHLNVTVQAYNALDLAALVDLSLGFDNFLPPTLMPLRDPPELSALVLPERIRTEARRRLRATLQKHEGRYPEKWTSSSVKKFRSQLSRIITFLEGAEEKDLFTRFVARTVAQDRYRRQDIRTAIPELAPLFGAAPEAEAPPAQRENFCPSNLA